MRGMDLRERFCKKGLALFSRICHNSSGYVKHDTEERQMYMEYLLCVPNMEKVSRDTCNAVNNILARMSEKYKINIVPEPIRIKKKNCPDYCKKFRIYKELREVGGNAEAYLLKEEEDMILSVCKTPQEEELMKSCTYAYCYPSQWVLKAFKDSDKTKKQ